MSDVGTLFSAIAGANKRSAQEKKNIARVEAAINTAVAITKASPNPFAITFAAAIGVAQQVAISNANFASGGRSKGGVYRVGEQGPEDVFLPRGAAVYNAMESKTTNNNQQSTAVFNFYDKNGNQIESIRRSIRSGEADGLLRDIKQKVAA